MILISSKFTPQEVNYLRSILRSHLTELRRTYNRSSNPNVLQCLNNSICLTQGIFNTLNSDYDNWIEVESNSSNLPF